MKHIIFYQLAILSLISNMAISQCTFFNLNYTFTEANRGQTVNVTWTTDCPSNQLLSISIIGLSCNCVMHSYHNVPNTGSYNYIIPSNLSIGTAYFYVQNNPATEWDYGPHFELLGALSVEYDRNLHTEIENNSIYANWSTASESNNSRFEIQRSADGENFGSIGWVDGAGNSSEEKSYKFMDDDPIRSINYYRLKQIDYDGKYEYSKIVSMKMANEELAIFPNPTDELLNCSGIFQNTSYRIYSSMFENIKSGIIETDGQINIGGLQSGLYFISFANRSVFKFYKN